MKMQKNNGDKEERKEQREKIKEKGESRN